MATTQAPESTDLAVARYELERIQLQRDTEQRKAESERLLASCSHLMGDRQALLMARQGSLHHDNRRQSRAVPPLGECYSLLDTACPS